MPRKATITTEHLSYLRTAVRDEVPFTVMARNVGVCVDTCKRILHKHGIMEFEAAKYVAAAPLNPPPAMWSRPCMACGSTELRPKWQYRCDRCHEREAAGATDWYRPSARPSRQQPSQAPADFTISDPVLDKTLQRLPIPERSLDPDPDVQATTRFLGRLPIIAPTSIIARIFNR